MRSLDGLELEDGGGEVNWSEILAGGESASESDKSVNSSNFALEVPVRDAEEGSDSIDVDGDEVVLIGGWDAGGADDGAVVKVVPILILNYLVDVLGFLVHVSSDVEGRVSIDLLVFLFVASYSD